MKQTLFRIFSDIGAWRRGWGFYIEKKLTRFGKRFEVQKSLLVDILMARRGTYQRPFLHISLTVILVVGVLAAPILANAYPGGLPSNLGDYTPSSAIGTSLDLSEYGVETQVSEKPRDQVITYAVEKGDTLVSIGEKFGVSVDTIKWSNSIRNDKLAIGDQLNIPPVTGIVHKVREGESVYSIAKKYKTDAQKIVNFPFNDFADLESFALISGQPLVVPDGVQPEAAPIIPRALPPVIAGGTGQFQWPTNGAITQYPVWYHMAVDIANAAAPGIGAADSGTVTVVEYLRYGYGQHILVDHGNGFQSLYAHLSEIYIKSGEAVGRGQIIGRMGSSGRSTGTHLHFEIRKNGVTQNPLPYLK